MKEFLMDPGTLLLGIAPSLVFVGFCGGFACAKWLDRRRARAATTTIAIALFLLPVAPGQARTPWVAYGQSEVIFNVPLDNPAPNTAGAIGEVTAFPYTVPAGKVLYLKGWGIEAYPNNPGGIALFPWLGLPPITNAKCLHTTYCDNQTCQTSAVYALPAGTVLNVRIVSGENVVGSIVGWVLWGRA